MVRAKSHPKPIVEWIRQLIEAEEGQLPIDTDHVLQVVAALEALVAITRQRYERVDLETGVPAAILEMCALLQRALQNVSGWVENNGSLREALMDADQGWDVYLEVQRTVQEQLADCQWGDAAV